ncbi:DUF6398 domain-containing protein [Alienimonas chondri]|uniref:DUF6398 domain-containing protein n=1 Tax=Alienimonas chondri TaxID=2681879 RepID=A0ABX1VB98_9PLAN|nr:DUF6398 domain-containing protein [Alienimonas chondri]NNJ24696.1 hypothetical protein [Alienimonas chondri]
MPVHDRSDRSDEAGSLLDEVPLRLRSRFLQIVERTDALCEARLGDGYRDLCRTMAAALCQDGSPVGRGKPESWAAGVIYSVGSLNFLTDPSQDPHMRAEEVAEACGVSPATMYNKARILREGLDLSPLDWEWMLPERRERYPSAALGAPTRPRDRGAPGGKGAEPTEIHLVQYEVTEEPIFEEYDESLPPAERAAIEAVGAAAVAGEGADRLDEIRTLIERHPDHPPLRNFLAVALQAAGRGEEAAAEIEATYRLFPDYLFARLNYAGQLIAADRLDEFPDVFGGRLALAWLYPEREGRFHVSEFIGFHALMGQYHAAIGDYDAAERDYELCEDVAPNHPQVERLLTRLTFAQLAKALDGPSRTDRRRTPKKKRPSKRKRRGKK